MTLPNDASLVYVCVAPELARVMHVAQFDVNDSDKITLYSSHVPIVLHGLCALYVLVDASLVIDNTDDIVTITQSMLDDGQWVVCTGRSDGWCVVVAASDERIGRDLIQLDRDAFTLHLVHTLDGGKTLKTLTQAEAIAASDERIDLGARMPQLHPQLPLLDVLVDASRALRLSVRVNRWQEHRRRRGESAQPDGGLLGRLSAWLPVGGRRTDDTIDQATLIELLKKLKLTQMTVSVM